MKELEGKYDSVILNTVKRMIKIKEEDRIDLNEIIGIFGGYTVKSQEKMTKELEVITSIFLQ